jgi:hypothetical protein
MRSACRAAFVAHAVILIPAVVGSPTLRVVVAPTRLATNIAYGGRTDPSTGDLSSSACAATALMTRKSSRRASMPSF